MKPTFILNRLVTIMLLIGLLAACGQRGPLYLPEKGKPKKIKSSTARKAATAKPQDPAPVKSDAKSDEVPDTENESDNSDAEE